MKLRVELTLPNGIRGLIDTMDRPWEKDLKKISALGIELKNFKILIS